VIRCSDVGRGDRLEGTAPARRFWWVIDHPGPWPAHPIKESVLGNLTSWVKPLAERSDTTVLLSRQRDPEAPRRVYFADTVNGTLAVGQCGPKKPQLESCGDTLTLVCTHGRRDQCCAVIGRPLLAVVGDARESSHIGGHRFAPTVLLLPMGIVLGRCAADDWARVSNLGPDALPYYRGRTSLDGPGQVADAEARRIWNLGLTEALTVVGTSTGSRTRFRVSRGDEVLEISVESTEETCIPSCGKMLEATTVWRVISRS
jgi:hypothetical protein